MIGWQVGHFKSWEEKEEEEEETKAIIIRLDGRVRDKNKTLSVNMW